MARSPYPTPPTPVVPQGLLETFVIEISVPAGTRLTAKVVDQVAGLAASRARWLASRRLREQRADRIAAMTSNPVSPQPVAT